MEPYYAMFGTRRSIADLTGIGGIQTANLQINLPDKMELIPGTKPNSQTRGKGIKHCFSVMAKRYMSWAMQ